MHRFLFKDTNGSKSLTATVFVVGCVIVNLKLIFSGVTVGGITLAEFTGVDYGAALASLGGIYVMRRSTSKEKKEESANG